MDKYVYAVSQDGENKVKVILATSPTDAQDRIIRKYWNRYEDLNAENWEDFLGEIADLHDIIISEEVLLLETL